MSSSLLLVVACAGLYGLCTVLLWRNAKSEIAHQNISIRIIALVSVAILLHGYFLYRNIFNDGESRISLGLAISMAGWVSAILYLIISVKNKTIDLGIIVLPISFLALIMGTIYVGDTYTTNQIPPGVGWHILLAIPTYGVLCVAFAQACLLILHDRQLHKTPGDVTLPALPPIQTMDSTLAGLTLLGFALMTLNLVFGMASSLNYYGTIVVFNHHILLSIAAWIAFGCLLLGRKISGWRGEIAAKWTAIAFLILLLAYFGTRFVKEVLLSN